MAKKDSDILCGFCWGKMKSTQSTCPHCGREHDLSKPPMDYAKNDANDPMG